MEQNCKGMVLAIGAFGSWGILPLYWSLLSEVPALEVLCHRILWSFLFLLALSVFGRTLRTSGSKELQLKYVASMLFSAALIGGNWLIYILAVNSGNVLEASLGYFIAPLLNVLLGVLILGERVRSIQVLAFAFALCGVASLTVTYGRVPYFALGLAATIACYGLLKKFLRVSSAEALGFEMLACLAPALLYLLFAELDGPGTLAQSSWSTIALLVSTGAVTAIPLMWFSCAAKLLPMHQLGVYQYLSPSLQFLVAVFILHESFDSQRLVSFMLIWFAVGLYALEGAHRRFGGLHAVRQLATRLIASHRTTC